jgi:hypothetical protein
MLYICEIATEQWDKELKTAGVYFITILLERTNYHLFDSYYFSSIFACQLVLSQMLKAGI